MIRRTHRRPALEGRAASKVASFRARSTFRGPCWSGGSTPNARTATPLPATSTEWSSSCARTASPRAWRPQPARAWIPPRDRPDRWIQRVEGDGASGPPGSEAGGRRTVTRHGRGRARGANRKESGMAVDVDIDVEVLKCEIKKTYARVSEEPEAGIHLPDRARLGARPRLSTRPTRARSGRRRRVVRRRGQSRSRWAARSRRARARPRLRSRHGLARRRADGRAWGQRDRAST